MTTIAIDLDDPAKMSALLRRAYGVERLTRLADAIEAAADKRVIFLDVDEMDPPPNASARLCAVADEFGGFIAVVCRTVAARLDALTPPRPPEPTGRGAVVQDRNGGRPTRIWPGHPGGAAWVGADQ